MGKLLNNCSASVFIIFFAANTFAQITVMSQNQMIKSNHNFGLSNKLIQYGVNMTYNPSIVNQVGAAFRMQYVDMGIPGFDGYPSGSVGGFKTGGTYYPGKKDSCGMPVQLKNLDSTLRIRWKTYQENAKDADDKWWASINCIFDSGPENAEPVDALRDFDLVIQLESAEQDALTDVSPTGNTTYWWFARNTNGTIKPFTLYAGNRAYHWAVRYKFFNFPPGDPDYDKNDKVHIKFIPIDVNNIIPHLDHQVKVFVDASVEYLKYITIPAAERQLANNKVANPDLWLKSISAGYEVYTGDFVIENKYFYTYIDSLTPAAPTNLSSSLANNSITLNWNPVTTDSIEMYNIYRSVNNGPFVLLTDLIRTNSFTDGSITQNNLYQYYVKAIDRTGLVSAASGISSVNTVMSNILGTPYQPESVILVYPNPVVNFFYIEAANLKLITVYTVSGENITQKIPVERTSKSARLDFSKQLPGLYLVHANGNTFKVIKK